MGAHHYKPLNADYLEQTRRFWTTCKRLFGVSRPERTPNRSHKEINDLHGAIERFRSTFGAQSTPPAHLSSSWKWSASQSLFGCAAESRTPSVASYPTGSTSLRGQPHTGSARCPPNPARLRCISRIAALRRGRGWRRRPWRDGWRRSRPGTAITVTPHRPGTRRWWRHSAEFAAPSARPKHPKTRSSPPT